MDGSPASRAALSFAFEEAALRDVPLVALCALADAPGVLGGAREMEEHFGQLMIAEEKEHPEITVLGQVAVGPPRRALLAAASEAQMLVVGCRGRGGVKGMSLGSVAQAVLHHSPCPVELGRALASRRWPLFTVLATQAVLSARLVQSNTAFQDEGLYLWSGHLELAHLLHHAQIPDFTSYFSGAPVIYPVIAALADQAGGLAGARLLSLALSC